MEIAGHCIFTKSEATTALAKLHNEGVLKFHITFAVEPALNARQQGHNANELALFDPWTKWTGNELPTNDLHRVQTDFSSDNRITVTDHRAKSRVDPGTAKLSPFQDVEDIDFEDICDDDAPQLDIVSLCAISALRSGLDFSADSISTDIMLTVINSIMSQAIAPAEQALGKFTRRKLKTMDTWNDWEAGERKQLNQFHNLQMFGEYMACPLEDNAVILRLHWQYHVKRDGQRRARQCCDGSKRAAPLLHALAKTHSSCVEQPIQRQFLALAAEQNFLLFGGDAKDAFAHSPAPEVPTFMMIDNQYYEWYLYKFKKKLDRSGVLLVLQALQGHPESGKLWE